MSRLFHGTRHRRRPTMLATSLAALLVLTACGGAQDDAADPADAEQPDDESEPVDDADAGDGADFTIGVSWPLLTTDFWTATDSNLRAAADRLGVNLIEPIDSGYDAGQQLTDIQNLLAQGVDGLLIGPVDSQAIVTALDEAAADGVPVVLLDVAAVGGEAELVVRASNILYGENSCRVIGEGLGGQGKTLEIQGDLASVNGRDRSEGFHSCMEENYPDIEIFTVPTAWDGESAFDGAQTTLTAHPDLDGIFMHCGGCFLSAVFEVLDAAGRLVPAGEEGHVIMVSNDGIPEEHAAIRDGLLTAAVSQPADVYAERSLEALIAALQGTTFEEGTTDQGSEIVRTEGGLLEDQVSAPLVALDCSPYADFPEVDCRDVDDPSLWGNP